MKKVISIISVIAVILAFSNPVFADERDELPEVDEPPEQITPVTEPTEPIKEPETVQNVGEPSKEQPSKETPAESKPKPDKETKESTKKVVIQKVSSVAFSNVKPTSLKIRWKKTPKATGYSIYRYSTKKKKFVKVKSVTGTSTTIKKLKSNLTYKFKVRAYCKEGNKNYYGAFSDVKKVRTPQSKQQKIVTKAKSKIGSKYVYGNKGPNSFDCSGFVYWTYKNAGVKTKKSFKRSSCQGMYSTLKSYRVKNPKAGDIVLYNRGGKFKHTAIYIGNGKIVHASTPKRGVCKASVSAPKGTRTYIRLL